MKISFHGAVKEVTGSAHLLQLDSGYSILLECGMFQGSEGDTDEQNRNWGFDPGQIDCVILSHAHIDHIGRLPKLVKDGFKGDIYSTPATRSLALIMLLDSAKIQEYDHYYEEKRAKKQGKESTIQEPLYDSSDVYTALSQFVTVNYDRWCTVNEQASFIFKDAGHILGSASVKLKINEDGNGKTIGFTGDIGRPNRPILRDPQPLPPVDVLITETTYGNRSHESAPNELKKLHQIIEQTCVKNQGKLIIPAFSLGRTQEIVYMLDQMVNDKILPKIPVYVDSPLSVNATRIFRMHPECYDQKLQDYIEFDPDPFGFNGLHYVTEVQGSKNINKATGPCIIISSSGMANAGRIRHHLKNNIGNPKNTILFVGYCAPGTTGAYLKDKPKTVTLFGEQKRIRANILSMDSFSAHADREELLDYLKNQKENCKQIFLVHGNEEASGAFAKTLINNGFKNIILPDKNEEFNL